MSVLASILRGSARLPVLRRLRKLDVVDRLADAYDHGRLIRQTGRFVVREMSPRDRTASYRPHGSRLDVLLRHHTSDRFILAEIFRDGLYTIPAEPRRRLLALQRPSVVDIGAHIGLAGIFFLTELPDARIVAFEPDPGNLNVLKRCIEQNRLQDRWTVVAACAGAADGTTRFVSGRYAESQVGEDPLSIELPVRDVFPHLADADLIKLDAEGAEWAILSDARFRELTPALVALEYHPQKCPGPDPRDAALTLLAAAGYDVAEVEVPHAPAGVGMLMAWPRE